jgi:hypothetical protein
MPCAAEIISRRRRSLFVSIVDNVKSDSRTWMSSMAWSVDRIEIVWTVELLRRAPQQNCSGIGWMSNSIRAHHAAIVASVGGGRPSSAGPALTLYVA